MKNDVSVKMKDKPGRFLTRRDMGCSLIARWKIAVHSKIKQRTVILCNALEQWETLTVATN